MNHSKQVCYKEIVFYDTKNNSKHNPEAIQNMARHPRTSPITTNVRDNNIPTNSPLMIVPLLYLVLRAQ
jgi:hypothetical protein